MKTLAFVLVALLLAYLGVEQSQRSQAPADTASHSNASTSQSTQSNRQSRTREESHPRANTQFEGEGIVEKVLPDDRQGSRHQRFIVRLASGRTVLIAHNIDLAPRVANLRAGDAVAFSGEFEENDKGGVVHWTHRDPARRHVDGWIRHHGNLYQ
jgi:hypothetical protein